MQEIAPGIRAWRARHPEADGTEGFPTEVFSYLIDDGDRLLIFDPVLPPSAVFALARTRESHVILTNPWHDRSARDLVETLGVPVWLPAPDDGTGDSGWLLEEKVGEAHVYSPADGLPRRLRALRGHKWNDLVIYSPDHEAVVSGDTLVNFGSGLEIHADWLPPGVTHTDVATGLRPLLDLPVRHVLATHGGPHDRKSLERALLIARGASA